MMELVSVVVPVYNVEKYLDRCLQSITEQTYSNLEIILVDDGSQDASGRICDLWAQKDARIKVVHKENAGPGTARNVGLSQVSGAYVFFFDSDDYVDQRVVEKCVRNAEKYGSDVVMFGRYNVCDDIVNKTQRLNVSRLLYTDAEIQRDLMPLLFTYELGFGVSLWGKMFRTQSICKHGLCFKSERETIAEDAYFMLEFLSKAETASIIPERLYYYCTRSNSFSRGYRKDRQLRNDEFLNQCVNYIEKNALSPRIVPHLQSRYHGMTLGTMMQIIRAELPLSEKRRELNKIYHNECLRKTLVNEVLSLDAKFPRTFWYCLKYKQYWLCTLLLYANTYR